MELIDLNETVRIELNPQDIQIAIFNHLALHLRSNVGVGLELVDFNMQLNEELQLEKFIVVAIKRSKQAETEGL